MFRYISVLSKNKRMFKNCVKPAIFLMVSIFVLLSLSGCWKDTVTVDNGGAKKAFDETVNYYRCSRTNLSSWWELVALWGAAGEDLNDGTWKLPEWESADLPAGSSAVSYAGYILGALSRGEDPAKMWGERNLLLELQEIQRENGGFGGTVNNTIWAIIALDAAGGEYHEEKALEYLLSRQKKDGGFALYGESGDPDLTGMALIALSNHRDKENAKKSIKEAVDYLKGAQLETAGFASFHSENSNSTAVVISGLTAVGENLLRPDWVKKEYTPLDALLSFQLKDGSFSYLKDPLTFNEMSTYHSLIALGDMVEKESVFVRLKELSFGNGGKHLNKQMNNLVSKKNQVLSAAPGSKPGDNNADGESTAAGSGSHSGMDRISENGEFLDENKEDGEKEEPGSGSSSSDVTVGSDSMSPSPSTDVISISIKVIGKNRVYFTGEVQLESCQADAFSALKETGLSIKNRPGEAYVREIEGESEDLESTAGWKYKVNGSIPNVSSEAYLLQEGDFIIWWYAQDYMCSGPNTHN